MVYAIKSIDLKTNATIILHVVCMRCQLLIKSNKTVLIFFNHYGDCREIKRKFNAVS